MISCWIFSCSSSLAQLIWCNSWPYLQSERIQMIKMSKLSLSERVCWFLVAIRNRNLLCSSRRRSSNIPSLLSLFSIQDWNQKVSSHEITEAWFQTWQSFRTDKLIRKLVQAFFTRGVFVTVGQICVIATCYAGAGQLYWQVQFAQSLKHLKWLSI
jgi:hypothetical protein